MQKKMMLKTPSFMLKSIVPLIACLFFMNQSHAQVLDGVDSKTADTIKSNFEKNVKIPADKINYIGKSDFPGMYVILANGFSLPIYSDAKLNKMFVGNYIDNTKDKLNLIEEIKEKHYKIEPNKFVQKNNGNLIVDKKGTGEKKMYVFADANCGYCKKLESEVITQMNNITVYTVPISILRPGAEMDKKVKNLLCKPEAQQGKLWLDSMLNNQGDTTEAKCEKANVLESNTEIAKQLNITGTPTIIFPNGSVHVGFIGLVDLEKKLNNSQK